MDNRTEIINNVLSKMQHDLTDKQLTKLRDALYIQLNDYEVEKRSTDVALPDNHPDMALKKFIATKRLEGRSENTIRLYSLTIGNMLHTLNKPVDEIDVYDLRFYLASYQEKNNDSNSTIESMRSHIRTFFSWLTMEGMISSDPSAALSPIKCEKKTRKPFSPTEMEKLRQACTTKRDRALIEFLYATGCRISEALALNRDGIDFVNKCAVVMGKGGKERTVYMSDTALLYLTDYLESRTDGDPCLFRLLRATDGDNRLAVAGAEKAIHEIGNRAGIPDAHPHRFRRTLASNMISRGAPIQDVSTILGHESIRTTQVYCSISQDDVKHTYHRCIA